MEWEDDPQDRHPINEAFDTINTLRRELEAAQAEVERLGEDIDAVNCYAEKLSDHWMLQYRGFLDDINDSKAELEAARAEIDILRVKNSTLANALEQIKDAEISSRADLAAAQDEIEDLTVASGVLRRRNVDLAKHVVRLTDKGKRRGCFASA